MSRRETSLCDIEVSNYNNRSITCCELSVATCALCQRDVCRVHAMHTSGGLLLRADSISVNTAGGNPQDVIWSPGSGQVVPYPQAGMQSPMIRVHLCKGCRQTLNERDIQVALSELYDTFVKTLAAAMTAKGLDAK